MKAMKHLLLLLTSFTLLIMTSCGDDEEPSSGNGTEILQLDGDNFTAPTFGAGFYEFAVRFTNNELSPFVGESITEVSFYLYEMPSFMNVTFSPDLTFSEPAAIAYEQEVTNASTNSWNTIKLDTPYPVDGSAIWIGIQVDLTDVQQTVGCDQGPARANGDWLYDDNDRNWDTFRNRIGESVNWNIRATVTTAD